MEVNASKSEMKTLPELRIFYDGGCHVCAWEVEKYLAVDRLHRLGTIDINAADFDAKIYGLDPAAVRKYFHVLTHDGRVVAGVDAFIEIWQTLATPVSLWGAKAAKIAWVHRCLEMGYSVFVDIRPYLPRRKEARCDDGTCDIRPSKKS